jgi:hypothetical protein
MGLVWVLAGVLAGVLALSPAGCVSGGRSGVQPAQPRQADISGVGAVDGSFFRDQTTSIFRPLDLPTPNDQRTASGAPGVNYWQQRCDYVIDASLDESTGTVRGKATITYTNNSPDPLEYIWIHLEQNLYKKDSLGRLAMGEDSGLGGAGDVTSGMTLESLTLGGTPLKYTVYDTLARVDLPRPLPPRSTLSFDASWSFQIPRNGSDRMGREEVDRGTLFLVAQWYPAVAVYDDVHGWNTLPYLSVGEFYFDFGSFDVRLTVPRTHIVSATGLLQNPGEVLTPTQTQRLALAATRPETTSIISENEVGTPDTRPAGDAPTLTWRFKADQIRSFAWASSRAFLWDAAGAQGLSHPVLAQSFYPREAIQTWSKATEYLRFSIEHYSRDWFEYPYPVASNINGPVPGMEYPMIIFCAAREDPKDLFGVTTHEIGHNWFPMTVNTDERRHAWMDEGFNTFINFYAHKAYFHQDSPDDAGMDHAAADTLQGQMQPIETPPDSVWHGRLGYLAYGRPATTLRLLREVVLGPERFDGAFRSYIRRWAFKSPRPADFFRSMEDASGMDLAWFWRGFVLEPGVLDQSVVGVADPAGDSPAKVAIFNRGTQVMPVRLRVTLADGTSRDVSLPVQIWATTNQWVAPVDTGGQPIDRVELDPDGLLPDIDRSNDLWPRREGGN